MQLDRNRDRLATRMHLLGALAATLLTASFATGALAEAMEEHAARPPGSIEFEGRNLFATANGSFHAWRLVESSVDLAALEKSSATVEVDLASVDTGITRRDDHLRDPDFFEVETWPTARVRVHSAQPAGETEDGRRRFTARFEIDLHGVTKTLPGEVVLVSEAPLAFEGSLVIDRTEFGVGAPHSRWNPMSVRNDIPVRFRVEF